MNGLEVRRLAYKSFGEEAENQGSGDDPKYTYTGKEQDSSGLYYYGARYYDPALSRFLTADTMVDVGPQGLNRYSYVLNNPIKFIDPTGLFKEELEGEYGEIEKGDTLSEIAEQTDTTVEELMNLNPQIKDEDKIYEGDQLKIRKDPLFRIIPRSVWGARPPIPSKLDPKNGYTNITLHHSGDKGMTSAYDIQGLHMSHGYGDIGYHWIIMKNGRILEGRDMQYKGSHVGKRNTGRIGILVIGDFQPQWWDSKDEEPTQQQIDTLKIFIKQLKKTIPTIATLGGHRDYIANPGFIDWHPIKGGLCPGDSLYDRIPEIRKETGLGGPY